jgi:hypothetical protein
MSEIDNEMKKENSNVSEMSKVSETPKLKMTVEEIREKRRLNSYDYYHNRGGIIKKKDYYNKNKERINARAKKILTAEEKEKRRNYMAKYMKDYYNKNPEKVIATVMRYKNRQKEKEKNKTQEVVQQ